ncbi:MAG: potassium channel family protein [Gemmataceae bacterium]
MTVLYAVAGGVLALAVLLDAFESVVLPRRVTRPYRLTRFFYRTSWRAFVALTLLIPEGKRRQSVLGVFGPLSLLALFTLWAGGLVVGFGMLHQAAAPEGRSFGESLYLSGTTFTTLGYGDMTPVGGVGRALAVTEALLGFGFLAIIVSYLPIFYQTFSRREIAISLLDARAGSPPSGGELLVRLLSGGGPALGRVLEEFERWSAEVLESHLSYPVLSFYRSQHDNQSWLAAILCALDASALLLTVARGSDRQQARLTFAMARHTLVDLALVLRRPPVAPPADRLPPERLAALLKVLTAAGVTVQEDAKVLTRLAEVRALYEPYAQALADYLRLELPTPWRQADRPDNWQTSAWSRRAEGIHRLGDDHFD